jgi:hypothetical protein
MRLSILLILTSLVACTEGAVVPTLSRGDVTGIPPGDATGGAFVGSYVVVSYLVVACQCRIGNCREHPINVANILSVTQQNGTLAIGGFIGSQCSGGVNSDGSFSCGLSIEESGFVMYERQAGMFSLATGQPDGIETLHEVTLVTSFDGNVDCDFRARSRSRYQGPLATSDDTTAVRR